MTEDEGLTAARHGRSPALRAQVQEDPCGVLGGRCQEFDDRFWALETYEPYDVALTMTCNEFKITKEQGEAILVCHDAMDGGNF